MLQAVGLAKWYSGVPAVRDVTFAVRRGDVLGILGPNGSGKSTTVSMLVGLVEPSFGSLSVDGEPIDVNREHYTRRIGYVPEEANLYTHMTGPEYLEFTGEMRGIEKRILAARVEGFLALFKLEDDRHVQMAGYSKGMRQKVSIAAALLHDPEIVVLDEPCSGLDVTFSLVLHSLIRQLAAAGKMVVYSSHVLEFVERVASEVMILHDSRVVARDSATRLKELLAVQDLEEVFKHVVRADNPDAVATELMKVMTL